MHKDGKENSNITEKSDNGANHTHLRAFAYADPIQDTQQHKYPYCNPEGKRSKCRNHHAEIQDAGETAEGSSKKVIDQDKHTSQGTHPVVHRLSRYSYHAAALGKALGHL